MESYARAYKGVYQLIEMRSRIHQDLPTVEIVDGSTSAEGTDRLLAGFEWQIATTVTPPLKSATMTVSYTDAGYAVLYEEEATGGEQ